MSTKDHVKKPKRPDMAIYTPRGRRAQEETRQSPDDASQSQPSKTALRKDQPPPERRNASRSDRGETEKYRKPSGESDNRHRTSRVVAEGHQERPEESRQHRTSRAPAEKNREESNQYRPTRVFTAKSREHLDEPSQHRAHRATADGNRRMSEESDRASVASQSKGRSTVTSETISNGHGSPRAAESPPAEPKSQSAPVGKEARRLNAATSPRSDERAIDLTVKPVDLSMKPSEDLQRRTREATDGGEGRREGASSPPSQRHRDASPGSRRRPRGGAGVYVPRAARRHCDSTGEPPSSSDERPQPSEAAAPTRQDCGDTADGRPARTESRSGPDPTPPRTAGSHRRRDSEKSAGRGDGEKRRTASPQSNSRDEKRQPARKEPPAAADPQSCRTEGVRTSSSRSASRVEDRESPPVPVSRPRVTERSSRRVERQRDTSPSQADLASLTLEPAVQEPPVPAVRRSVPTDQAESQSNSQSNSHGRVQPQYRRLPHSHPQPLALTDQAESQSNSHGRVQPHYRRLPDSHPQPPALTDQAESQSNSHGRVQPHYRRLPDSHPQPPARTDQAESQSNSQSNSHGRVQPQYRRLPDSHPQPPALTDQAESQSDSHGRVQPQYRRLPDSHPQPPALTDQADSQSNSQGRVQPQYRRLPHSHPQPPARTDQAESVPSSGLLYVPGGPHSDPPEPPSSHSQSNSHGRIQPQYLPLSHPKPPARHLFDPNNPGQVVEVTPRTSDARDRRHQEVSQTYSDPNSSGGPPAAGFSDPFSLPANSTNANRISQLLGRTAGEMEFIITSGRLLSNWRYIFRIRSHVQIECTRVLVSDLRTWMTLGIDQTIWKSLYYCVIEELRTAELSDQQWALNEIIDNGMDFFSSLLTTLQKTYDIPVYHISSVMFDQEPIRRKRYFSSVAALSQRLLLCMGDLARYQHQLGRLPNLVQPHTFYLQAQQMNPKNGRPFNQLAIVALYGHKRLDCVYLYARALMAANPFHTAKESLLSLFHESSRRYAARSPMPGHVVTPAAEQREETRGADLRTETWVHPGRGDRLQRTLRTERDDTPPELPELRRMPDSDLLKAFTTTYLHVQGKLYTRVSLETYQEDACVMLRQFSELLSREPMPLKSADMLHILGINMFNIANTKLKDERLGSELRSTYQELALAVAIEMAGHVIQRACQLLSKSPLDGGGTSERLFQPCALETCMVFVKVWCDWLLSSSAIWNPPPCTADYRVSGVTDCWASLAELTNLLRLRDTEDTRHRPANTLRTTSNGEKGEMVVRLEEDLCLESFTPLLCGEHRTAFVNREQCDMDRARDLMRLRCVLFVTEQFLCGTEPAALRLLKTADGACRYVSQVSSHAPAGAEDGGRPDSPDVQVEWSREDGGEEEDEDEEGRRRRSAAELLSFPASADSSRPELARLQQQKLALERRARRQEEHSRRVQAIVSSAHASITLEVRPRYLVADTNCYVDYLEQLQRLVREHSAYTLTVPVTVLAELDGLSRPGGGGRPRPGQSEEHVQHVRRTARAALSFVQQRGAPHVRCATSRGHLLSSAMFTAEDDDDEQATNDDRILSCCRNLERGVAEQQPDGGQHLTREVVLLTDDRNLRLKALSLDVPTRTVPDFLAWAS